MSRSGKTDLVLLCIALLLGGLTWFSLPVEPVGEHHSLTGLTPDSVDRIRLSNSRGTDLTLERIDRQWIMIEPFRVTADANRVSLLLELVRTRSIEQFPVPTDRLAEFGLKQPQALLQLNDLQLAFGSTDPINHRRYVRIGERVHLINDRFPHHLMASNEDYISTALIPTAEVDRIRTPSWSLEYRDAAWVLTPPDSSLSMDDLVLKAEQWRHARALEVRPLLHKPSGERIEISTRGDAQQRVMIHYWEAGYPWLQDLTTGLAYRLPADSRLTTPPTPGRISD